MLARHDARVLWLEFIMDAMWVRFRIRATLNECGWNNLSITLCVAWGVHIIYEGDYVCKVYLFVIIFLETQWSVWFDVFCLGIM